MESICKTTAILLFIIGFISSIGRAADSYGDEFFIICGGLIVSFLISLLFYGLGDIIGWLRCINLNLYECRKNNNIKNEQSKDETVKTKKIEEVVSQSGHNLNK